MKKIFSCAMIVAMAFALVSCGGGGEQKDTFVQSVIKIYQQGTAEVKTCITDKQKVREVYNKTFDKLTKLAAENLDKLTANDYQYCRDVEATLEVRQACDAWETEFHKSDSSVWGWATPVTVGNATIAAEDEAKSKK